MTPRIAILSTTDETIAYMDNDAPGALPYYSEELHTYLEGASSVFTFKVPANHPDAINITSGNKVAFRYDGTDYYFSILKTVQIEKDIQAMAYGSCFEFLNETVKSYSGTNQTFVQYVNAMGFNTSVMQIGINEVSEKKATYEWTSEDTVLNRLFSLASLFGAEIEFKYQLEDNYSLSGITLNVYQEHSDTAQGIGEKRSDIILRYGKEVSGIEKTVDVTQLYTCITPTGKDGLTINEYVVHVYDENGSLLYFSERGQPSIYAPQARNQFPSSVLDRADRYIRYAWSTDYETVNALGGNALSKLKELSQPKISYKVTGYADLNIGDTIRIDDWEFNPVLHLEARVTEQQICFTDPSQNRTTFDNFSELASEISGDLAERAQALALQALTTATTVLDNSRYMAAISVTASDFAAGTATLQARLFEDGAAVDISSGYSFAWYKNGVLISGATSNTIEVTDVTAIYSVNITK